MKKLSIAAVLLATVFAAPAYAGLTEAESDAEFVANSMTTSEEAASFERKTQIIEICAEFGYKGDKTHLKLIGIVASQPAFYLDNLSEEEFQAHLLAKGVVYEIRDKMVEQYQFVRDMGPVDQLELTCDILAEAFPTLIAK